GRRELRIQGWRLYVYNVGAIASAAAALFFAYLLYLVTRMAGSPETSAYLIGLTLLVLAIALGAGAVLVALQPRWMRLVLTRRGFTPPGRNSKLVRWSAVEELRAPTIEWPVRGGAVVGHYIAYRLLPSKDSWHSDRMARRRRSRASQVYWGYDIFTVPGGLGGVSPEALARLLNQWRRRCLRRRPQRMA